MSKNYSQKLVTKKDFISLINQSNNIFIEQGPAEPLALIKMLMESSVKGLKLIIVPLPNINKLQFALPIYADQWDIYAFFSNKELVEASSGINVEYIPIHLSEIPKALSTKYKPDITLVQVTPPNSSGFCSLGAAVEYNKAAVKSAKIVVAQANRKMPFTCGDSCIHISEIDYIVEEDQDLVQIPSTLPKEVESQIGENVSSLIDNGSTIQVGIGRVPDAVMLALRSKSDLGIHSGVLTESMLNLIESGVVTGIKKSIDSRKVVTGQLLGTDRLYEFSNCNPVIEVHPTTYTHNSSIIRGLYKFVSINSALEIDLTGQINSEFIEGKQISSVGGQVDFARIARLSPKGKSIIAMPSTVQNKSKIVPHLSEDAPVSIARTDVDFVVTEFGVADLRYLSLKQRALKLINIAHPDYRKELCRSIKRLSI